jgi:hypothetical protein
VVEPSTDKPSDIPGLEKWMKALPYLFAKCKTENEKKAMVDQLNAVDDDIGGLEDYIRRAKNC